MTLKVLLISTIGVSPACWAAFGQPPKTAVATSPPVLANTETVQPKASAAGSPAPAKEAVKARQEPSPPEATRKAGLSYPRTLVIEPMKFGEQREIAYPFENRTDKPVRILGASDLCGRNFCVTSDVRLLIEIKARSKGLAKLHITVGKVAGDFEAPLTIYTDCPGQFQVRITIKGRTVKP